jgi:threonyl-tRNA synthetase
MTIMVLLPQMGSTPLAVDSCPSHQPLTARKIWTDSGFKPPFHPIAALWQGKLIDLDAPLSIAGAPSPADKDENLAQEKHQPQGKTPFQLSLVDPASNQGLDVLRHSCAHILAQAVKELFADAQVTIGPVIQDGFYYDFYRQIPFRPEDLDAIQARMKAIVERNLPVVRHLWSRDEAIDFFHNQGEDFKVKIIQDIPATEQLSVYQQGDFFDLCRGPHAPSTGQVMTHFALTKMSAAYWRADSRGISLQRIYGTAWARAQDLAAYKLRIEEAAQRDHRKIAAQMDLLHFQEEAPGSIFWHGPGWTLYTTLQAYMRARQQREGYIEVNTPQLLANTLWEASGHWQKYRDNMFTIATASQDDPAEASPGQDQCAADLQEQPQETNTSPIYAQQLSEQNEADKGSDQGKPSGKNQRIFALKPMNCPCHVQIFNHGLKSYRDLPLRMAEFGSCLRNEASGARAGMMRVTSFVQDDAHIFCTPDQMIDETRRFCQFLFSVYKDLGFTDVLVRLSTRPDTRLGDETLWDRAEAALHEGAQAAGLDYEINPGEGAFYGPKLEFTLKDSLGRLWQCGTLQMDFVLPQRLGAFYTGPDGQKHHTVMLHRAILGSFERFLGVLLEHTAGHLPAWLTPTQAVITTITDEVIPFAHQVQAALKGLRVQLDDRNEKLGFKVREHTLRKVPYILVVGKKEAQEGQVTLRQRDGQETLALDCAVKKLRDLCAMPEF